MNVLTQWLIVHVVFTVFKRHYEGRRQKTGIFEMVLGQLVGGKSDGGAQGY